MEKHLLAKVVAEKQTIKESLEKMFRAYQLSELSETDDILDRAIITDSFLTLQKFLAQLDEQ